MSHSPAHQRKNKQTNKKTQHKSYRIQAYTNHGNNLRGKKEFNLEAWEMETSNTVRFKKKKKKEKAEKYYTNEGTNYKHRHPSK